MTKLNSTGTAVVYSIYLGGSGNEWGTSIAVDSAGNCHVTGFTCSLNFPTTGGAFQMAKKGSVDVFVAKLNSTGTGLVYSTYFGGSGDDENSALAIDSFGNTFVTGSTESPDFPTVSPMQVATGGGRDCFVAKFGPTGLPIFSTYFGGSNNDRGHSIAVDTFGNAYVSGSTNSANFPITTGAFQIALGGGDCIGWLCGDAFVAKLNSVGSALIYSTYMGGQGVDGAVGIAVDANSSAYVTGMTDSVDLCSFLVCESFLHLRANNGCKFIHYVVALFGGQLVPFVLHLFR